MTRTSNFIRFVTRRAKKAPPPKKKQDSDSGSECEAGSKPKPKAKPSPKKRGKKTDNPALIKKSSAKTPITSKATTPCSSSAPFSSEKVAKAGPASRKRKNESSSDEESSDDENDKKKKSSKKAQIAKKKFKHEFPSEFTIVPYTDEEMKNMKHKIHKCKLGKRRN